jgi:hypothetical protein
VFCAIARHRFHGGLGTKTIEQRHIDDAVESLVMSSVSLADIWRCIMLYRPNKREEDTASVNDWAWKVLNADRKKSKMADYFTPEKVGTSQPRNQYV